MVAVRFADLPLSRIVTRAVSPIAEVLIIRLCLHLHGIYKDDSFLAHGYLALDITNL